MAAIYQTPGVYVEEITKFPPSVAPVETAIPAFIGYTERAIRNGESLIYKPIRIESIAEYEEMFGAEPRQDVTVFLDNDNNFVKGEANVKLYLYDSLRMFYANGGGKCYIVSVGDYSSAVSFANLKQGIDSLRQEDEPTIILSPDAISDANGPYEFQKEALRQCNDLKDRVTICDLITPVGDRTFADAVADFRQHIDIHHLKYGAAYGPCITANFPRKLLRKNLSLKRDGSKEVVQLEELTNDQNIRNIIRDIKLAEKSKELLQEGSESFDENILISAIDQYRNMPAIDWSDSNKLSVALQKITNITLAVLKKIYDIKNIEQPGDTQYKITSSINLYLSSSTSIKSHVLSLVAHYKIIINSDPIIILIDDKNTSLDGAAQLLDFKNGKDMLDTIQLPDVTKEYIGIINSREKANVAQQVAYATAQNAIAMLNLIKSSICEFEKSLNDSLLNSFGKFKELITKGAESLNLLPPSGAIAGVYATVDRERGVWKAPANVSLNSVIRPAVKISHEQQAEYNVDVNAGKSINIIRSFTGKGTLVWGARTLAGNDNEWRYINVRRFFNFAEESIKKATEPFVFEPNDANTWVRVQAMIENFLTTLWRQGALQGVKPEHAFYVAVGLGKTMTALDIQEGRMIIEIGMAVVRPAEFIILKFSHKMAES